MILETPRCQVTQSTNDSSSQSSSNLCSPVENCIDTDEESKGYYKCDCKVGYKRMIIIKVDIMTKFLCKHYIAL